MEITDEDTLICHFSLFGNVVRYARRK